MSQGQPQPQFVPAMPQYVMVPARERNGLGVFGFLVALVGLFIPTGIVCLLGLMISLVALGRPPRALAAMGVVLGLLGSAVWLVISLVAIVVAMVAMLVGAIAVAGAFVLTQPEVVEVTTDMVNVTLAAKHYEQERQGLPASLDDLELSDARRTDPWGNRYVLQPASHDLGFDLVSSGPDGRFDTDDDIHLVRLDEYWEQALRDFEDRMEELGENLEARGEAWSPGAARHCPFDGSRRDYETAALEALLKEASKSADSANPKDTSHRGERPAGPAGDGD